MPVQIDQASGHWAHLVDDLGVMLPARGKTHEQQAARLGIGERRDVFGQFFNTGWILKAVTPPFTSSQLPSARPSKSSGRFA